MKEVLHNDLRWILTDAGGGLVTLTGVDKSCICSLVFTTEGSFLGGYGSKTYGAVGQEVFNMMKEGVSDGSDEALEGLPQQQTE